MDQGIAARSPSPRPSPEGEGAAADLTSPSPSGEDWGEGRRRDIPAGATGLAEIARQAGDLKRTRDARSPHSRAAIGFAEAWSALIAGDGPASVATGMTADAVAAARLGGIDAGMMRRIGLSDPEALGVLHAGFDELAAHFPPSSRETLRRALGQTRASGPTPPFVAALTAQPRAGATSPGKPRIVLEPPESHADHCFLVAVLGVLAADLFDADPAIVFLAGLSHHLHNAVLPDSGFAGEILLGAHLGPVMARLFDEGYAQLPAPLARAARHAMALVADATTPEGRAFHAADVIDRVVQMDHYAQVAAFTLDRATEDLQLVHEGPVQAFHHAVLRRAGLL